VSMLVLTTAASLYSGRPAVSLLSALSLHIAGSVILHRVRSRTVQTQHEAVWNREQL
jgi:hypothetical protein